MYLADSSMLNKLSPFFVVLFAYIFLKEKISKMQIPALILVFAAATLIIKPKFDLSVLPALAGFVGAAVAGAAYTLVRYLGSREKPATIVFFFSLISVLGMIPAVAANFVMPKWLEFAALLATGVFAAGGQFGLTYAYKYAPASEVAIYNYSHILFSAAVGFMFWGEVSDVYSIVGGSIMIIVSAAMYIYNRKR
jgi:drug/metabolite transporter (DMT)-like permease